MSEMAEGKARREPLHRTLFVKTDDLKLDTYEGQNEMLRRMQELVATTDHNNLDIEALKLLKDTVKVKTDLNVLKLFTQLKKEMDEWKSRQKEENPKST